MAITTRAAHNLDLAAVRTLLAQLHDPPEEVAWSTALWADMLADPDRTIVLAESWEEHPVGTADVIVVPNLTYGGSSWAIVENVVVDAEWRHRGVGTALIKHATQIAQEAGCYKVQLASSNHRDSAHRFYERMGFVPEAIGYRLRLRRHAGAGAA